MSKINKILKGEPSSAKIKPLNDKDTSQIPKLLTLSEQNVDANNNNNNNNNVKIDKKIWEVTATNFEEDYVSHVSLGKSESGAAVVQIGDNVFDAYNHNGVPIDIGTPEEMDIALSEDNIGRAYRYIGETTPEYTNGDIYIVREYQQLRTPVITINGSVVSWGRIDGALSYKVYVNNILSYTTTENRIDLDDLLIEAGTYRVYVVASGTGYHLDSNRSNVVTWTKIPEWEEPEMDGDDIIIRQAYTAEIRDNDLYIG